MPHRDPVRVAHLVGAMGGTKHLWGKENLVLRLMQAQRADGTDDPLLIVFTPCLLAELAAKDGFVVHVLEDRHRRLPFAALKALRAILAAEPMLLHTHDYKANIVGRLARTARIPMVSLVSSCYGWIDVTLALRLYQSFDRWTSGMSDVVTAPSEQMLRRFPRFVNAQYVPNGIPDRDVPSAAERARARAAFGWDDDAFVVGTISRLSPEKGITEFLDAARRSPDGRIVWAIAGAGPLEATVQAAQNDRLRYVGYVDSADAYFAAIDVFVQPSRTEALSLSLLEAMRGQLPIVATAVGATALAVRHEREGLLIAPEDPDQLLLAAVRLENDRAFARGLAAAARTRFEAMWRVEAQRAAFHDLYARSVTAR
jgi:glycosyltransferase involved in cell wall biosynthesis